MVGAGMMCVWLLEVSTSPSHICWVMLCSSHPHTWGLEPSVQAVVTVTHQRSCWPVGHSMHAYICIGVVYPLDGVEMRRTSIYSVSLSLSLWCVWKCSGVWWEVSAWWWACFGLCQQLRSGEVCNWCQWLAQTCGP